MPITNYGASLASNVLLGKAISSPSTLYIALATASPNATSTGLSLNEPSGGSYARASVVNNAASWTFDGYNTMSNTSAINFPTATSFWGRIGYWALCDAASAGNVIAYGTLNPVAVVSSGDTVIIAANSLSLSAFAPEVR